ncbi:hypothetical protein PCS_03160 [Desulfocurvibacter africanus PCS]|uniref:Uncharacterized protein n=1 Tax=Desulfocurvibacter africanus PCS TaxID=1262666 RepID=M5PZR9_DESAF|nr:hypothetical protein PCS_03160 [Desulfocurvibacter africanus PCS]
MAGPDNQTAPSPTADALTLLSLERCCYLGPQYSESKNALFNAYCLLCSTEGETPLSRELFFRDLRRACGGLRDVRPRVGRERPKRLRGVGLRRGDAEPRQVR